MKRKRPIINDSEPLRIGLEKVQSGLGDETGFSTSTLILLLLSAAVLAAGGAGLVATRCATSANVAALAETQRLEAERQEQEAKRVNDANQAAILRLMNELQTVAEGDLTQQATVTEDITGAIADSVNYTVEELRTAGVPGAGHGGSGDRNHAAGGSHVDRTARRLRRTAPRDPRNRRVGAPDGEPNQRRVRTSPADRRGGPPDRCRPPNPA